MNGIEFYQRMKEIDKKVKVCFITASEIHYYEKITKELFPTLGVRRLIRKPIKIEDLVKDLKQELEFVNEIIIITTITIISYTNITSNNELEK